MSTEYGSKGNQAVPMPQKGTAEDYNHIQNIVAVMSGKGGVGKSFVTGLLASGLEQQGFKVGILDADITGPSIPMLFGLHGPVDMGEFGIMPLKSLRGIKVISMNLLLQTEDQPVIWRGPLVSRGIKQLWGDVMWGDLDTLLIDLPPGTSDATLTIMQSLPVTGLVMVTTPQSLASMVVTKAINMAHITDVNIIGIVENMAYFNCPDTGNRHYIFGKSHSPVLAEKANAPILAQIPIEPNISHNCDAGNIEEVWFEGLDSFVEKFLTVLKIKDQDRRKEESIILQMQSEDDLEERQSVLEKEDAPALSAYSSIAREIIQSKENLGHFDAPDLHGRVRGCCGDSIQMEFLLEDNIIRDARFTTDGCSATIACGGMLTRLVKGKTLESAYSVEACDLIEALDGLPAGHLHCADLAVKTLRHVIDSKLD